MAATETSPEQFWDFKHSTYYPDLFRPTELAKKALPFFIKHSVGDVLEIGCGRSGDALYFASKGIRVFALDISFIALREIAAKAQNNARISFLQSNISQGLPFCDGSVDAIYSRLSLHYFLSEVTRNIFNDIFRILREPGCLSLNVKSTAEERLEQTNFENRIPSNGHHKHFFSVGYAKSLLQKFSHVEVVPSKIMSGESIERETIEVFAIKSSA